MGSFDSISTSSFPDPATYDFPEWVLADNYFYYARDIASFGNALTVENLIKAYEVGIFPWNIDGMPLPWFCPARRAILRFADLHIPRSLQKARRKSTFEITIDGAFRRVIESCSAAVRSGEGTWITPQFIEVYCELHDRGRAHSVEVWNDAGALVGGLYGVDAGGVFCGESMFHTESNASKFALLHLVDHLEARGGEWLDIQVMTPHLKALGAKEVMRKTFLRMLKETQARKLELFAP